MIEIFNMISSVILIMGFMYIVKLISDYNITKYDIGDVSIPKSNNYAYIIMQIGLYMGVSTAMLGTIGQNIMMQLTSGMLGIVFIYIALIVSDKIIFPNIDDRKEIIVNNHVSLGIISGSFIFSTGIIAYASFVGNGPLWTSIVFFMIGQLILVSTIRIYEYMYPKLLSSIADNNIAPAILLSSMFVSFAFVLEGALIGDYSGFVNDMIDIAKSVLFGLVMMVVVINKVVDKIFIPNITLNEMIETNNIAAIAKISAIKISLAMTIGYVVL